MTSAIANTAPSTTSVCGKRQREWEPERRVARLRPCAETRLAWRQLWEDCQALSMCELWVLCKQGLRTLEEIAIVRSLLAQGVSTIDVSNLPTIEDLLESTRLALESESSVSWGEGCLAASAILSVELAKLLIAPSGGLNTWLLLELREHPLVTDALPQATVYQEFTLAALHHIEGGFSEELEKCVAPCEEAVGLVRDILKLDASIELTAYHTRCAVLSALLSTPRQLPNIPSCFSASVLINSHLGSKKLLESLGDYRDLVERGCLYRKGTSYPIQHHCFAHHQNLLLVAREMTMASFSAANTKPLSRIGYTITKSLKERIDRVYREHSDSGLSNATHITAVFLRRLTALYSNRVRFDISYPPDSTQGVWVLEEKAKRRLVESSTQYRSLLGSAWLGAVSTVEADSRRDRYLRHRMRRDVLQYFQSRQFFDEDSLPLDGEDHYPWMGELCGSPLRIINEQAESNARRIRMLADCPGDLLRALLGLESREAGWVASVPEHCIVLRSDLMQEELRKFGGDSEALLFDLIERGRVATESYKISQDEITTVCEGISQMTASALSKVTNLEELGAEIRKMMGSEKVDWPDIECQLFRALPEPLVLPFVIVADANYHSRSYLCFARSPLTRELSCYLVSDRDGLHFTPLDWALMGPDAHYWRIYDVGN